MKNQRRLVIRDGMSCDLPLRLLLGLLYLAVFVLHPMSPLHLRVGPGLEDVCGNSITGAFDRPLRKSPNWVTRTNDSSLIFQLI